MLDATYEDLLSTYLNLCDRYEKSVDHLINHSRQGRHDDFNKANRLTKILAFEVERAYAALEAQRRTWKRR